MNKQLLNAISDVIEHTDSSVNLTLVLKNMQAISKWYAATKEWVNPDQCRKNMADIILFSREYCGYLKEASQEDKIVLTIGSDHYTAKRKELPGLTKVPKGSHYIFDGKGEVAELQELIDTFKAASKSYTARRDFTKATLARMKDMVEYPSRDLVDAFPELKPFMAKPVRNWFFLD